MGRLVVIRSSAIDENTEFELDSTGISIGRGGPNDVRLDADDYASANHARVEPRRDGVWIEDVGSTNGTFVNGVRLSRARKLAAGDLVRVGRHGPEVRDMSALGRSTGLSHPGRRRRRNEDAWVCHPPLFAVADGMGGARGGEIASRVAATALGETVDGSGEARVVALIQEANRQVYERAREDSDASGMGTTITVALFEDGIVSIGHVGDSRAYLIRDRKVDQLTEDHSLVAELVRTGRLSPEEAESHPQRSVITRALGTDPDVDVDSFSVEAKPGDLFLICSDGLTSMVGDEEILDVVEPRREDLDGAAKELVAAANRSGGEDNITVVFFEVVEDGAQAAAPGETKPMPALDVGAPAAGRRGHAHRARPRARDRHDGRAARSKRARWPTSADGAPGLFAEEEREPKPHLGVQAARVIIALGVIAGLLLLVIWLFGQSQ